MNFTWVGPLKLAFFDKKQSITLGSRCNLSEIYPKKPTRMVAILAGAYLGRRKHVWRDSQKGSDLLALGTSGHWDIRCITCAETPRSTGELW